MSARASVWVAEEPVPVGLYQFVPVRLLSEAERRRMLDPLENARAALRYLAVRYGWHTFTWSGFGRFPLDGGGRLSQHGDPLLRR